MCIHEWAWARLDQHFTMWISEHASTRTCVNMNPCIFLVFNFLFVQCHIVILEQESCLNKDQVWEKSTCHILLQYDSCYIIGISFGCVLVHGRGVDLLVFAMGMGINLRVNIDNSKVHSDQDCWRPWLICLLSYKTKKKHAIFLLGIGEKKKKKDI